MRYGGLAAAGMTDNGNFFTLLYFQVELLQRLDACIGISKVYITEDDISTELGLYRGRRVRNLRLGMQKLVDPFLGSNGTLYHTGRPPDGAHGKGEHIDIHHKFGDGI